MRPSRLVARGFAAFRDEIEIDFTDVVFSYRPSGFRTGVVIAVMASLMMVLAWVVPNLRRRRTTRRSARATRRC